MICGLIKVSKHTVIIGYILLFSIVFLFSCEKASYSEGDARNDLNKTGILDFNPPSIVIPKLRNLKTGYTQFGVSDKYPPVVSFLHFSDLHGNNINLLRIIEFVNKYQPFIDEVIQTGDLIPGTVKDGVPESWSSVPTWLSVIGNHDATIKINNKWTTVSSELSYNAIIAPYIKNWDVVQPKGAGENDYYPCYYFKDFSQSNLRLVVLDNMQPLNGGPTHWDATQKAWFEEVLNDARIKGYHVVIAVHYPPFATEHNPDNPFDSITVHPDERGWHTSPDIPNAVKGFIDAGGTFICYLTGHTHCDYFGLARMDGTYSYQAGWHNQLCIGIASASYISGAGIYGDSDRTVGTKSQDCFNIVGFDTTSKTLKIVRIGLEYDKYMRRKNTLCWDYGTGSLIYVD